MQQHVYHFCTTVSLGWDIFGAVSMPLFREPMEQDREYGEAELKARLNDRLVIYGLTLVWLAEKTGDPYKNVQRWIRGKEAVPGDFLGRYVKAVPVNPLWLLTGEGSPDPTTEDEAKVKLEVIRRVLALPTPAKEPADPDAALAELALAKSLEGLQQLSQAPALADPGRSSTPPAGGQGKPKPGEQSRAAGASRRKRPPKDE